MPSPVFEEQPNFLPFSSSSSSELGQVADNKEFDSSLITNNLSTPDQLEDGKTLDSGIVESHRRSQSPEGSSSLTVHCSSSLPARPSLDNIPHNTAFPTSLPAKPPAILHSLRPNSLPAKPCPIPSKPSLPDPSLNRQRPVSPRRRSGSPSSVREREILSREALVLGGPAAPRNRLDVIQLLESIAKIKTEDALLHASLLLLFHLNLTLSLVPIAFVLDLALDLQLALNLGPALDPTVVSLLRHVLHTLAVTVQNRPLLVLVVGNA
ncbi:hypothetical protein JCM3765_002499 [Sporobolomyces pararoseus]